MVQTTQARHGNHDLVRSWLRLYLPPVLRVLFERVVNAVFMMIVHVVADEPAKVRLIQRNHVIEDLAAATSDPALGDTAGRRRRWSEC